MDLDLKNTSTEQEEEEEKGTEIRLSEFVEADKVEREAVLRKTKDGVADLGRSSCFILISFIARRDDKEISEIFRRFRKRLERRIEPHHSHVVLHRIFALLVTGEKVLREQHGPDPYTMKLKGEAHQTTVFTREEKLNVCSMLDTLCDQIFFMEKMVTQVMSQPVGVENVGADIRECENCLKSMETEVSSRLDKLPSLNDGDGEESAILEAVMRERTREIWSKFELYH